MPEILAADIGGTNSRFAHFRLESGELSLLGRVSLDTQKAAGLGQVLGLLGEAGLELDPRRAEAAVFAVAGPVEAGLVSRPPNIPWEVDLTRVRPLLGGGPALLVNDFLAQAWAIRTSAMARAEVILPGQGEPNAAAAVLGAGTGLGQAVLAPDGKGGHLALASEGGHTAFPFVGPEEAGYQAFLMERLGGAYPIFDWVVSGRGLSLLHLYHTGREATPAQAAAGLEEGSLVLTWMARFLGRAARRLCLQSVALGGIYISGGVAAKNPILVRHPEFAREFLSSPRMAGLLAKVPVFLNRNQDAGLWGAAAIAGDMLKG